MNNLIQDAKQRERALDPRQSFIVQAPAGSGKTELLTQRFLVLLHHAAQPEEILAITFTRKAAAEMRSRIIRALQDAKNNKEITSSHAKKTRELACHVLERDQHSGWNLLNNPNRLRIQNIDSFNAYLTRQLPVLAHFGAPPGIADDAKFLYQHAVREFLSHLEENVAWSDAIAQLLNHLDNDINTLEELLTNMLAKREQWLPHITINANDHNLRKTLETSLKNIFLSTLEKVKQEIPAEYKQELFFLAQFAKNNLSLEIEIELFLPELLLTNELTYRKKML